MLQRGVDHWCSTFPIVLCKKIYPYTAYYRDGATMMLDLPSVCPEFHMGVRCSYVRQVKREVGELRKPQSFGASAPVLG